MKIDDMLLLISAMEDESLIARTRELINSCPENLLEEIYDIIEYKDKEKILENAKKIMKREHFEYVSVLEDDYPRLLRKIYDYPLGLFIKGNRKLLNKNHVSIVGTRKITHDGKIVCQRVIKHLAKQNVTIVSGLAFGVDITAHRYALEYKVPTISVLPSSVNSPVPRSNIKIAKEILSNDGLLISEKPPGYEVRPHSFVQRNRIISGMSDRTLIVEAAEKSGSLVTAKYALEQNREIYAVPGSITNPVAKGTNLLLKQGAIPVINGDDFYPVEDAEKNKSKEDVIKGSKVAMYLVEHGASDLDILYDSLDISFTALQVELMELELRGYVHRSNGKIYINE